MPSCYTQVSTFGMLTTHGEGKVCRELIAMPPRGIEVNPLCPGEAVVGLRVLEVLSQGRLLHINDGANAPWKK